MNLLWFSNNVLFGLVQISTRPNVHVLSDTKVFKVEPTEMASGGNDDMGGARPKVMMRLRGLEEEESRAGTMEVVGVENISPIADRG